MSKSQAHSYRVKEMADKGFGRFNLFQDGAWLETFESAEQAEIELASREEFDRVHATVHRST